MMCLEASHGEQRAALVFGFRSFRLPSRFGLRFPVVPAALLLRVLAIVIAFLLPLGARAADELVSNGGFENGFAGWTRWGKNADLITLDPGLSHSGTNSARIQHGQNALYFSRPLSPAQAYELRFAYRLTGGNPSGQVALGFFKQGGTLRSAGAQTSNLLRWPARRRRSGPSSARCSCPLPSPPPASSPSRRAMVLRYGLTTSRCGRFRGPLSWPSQRSPGKG